MEYLPGHSSTASAGAAQSPITSAEKLEVFLQEIGNTIEPEITGWRFRGTIHLLMSKGRAFIPPEFSTSGGSSDCYDTALNYALAHGLIYCEGWVWHSGMPMRHAWASSGQDVVEVVLTDPGQEYFGLGIDPAYAQRTGTPVIESERSRWPLVTG